MRLFFAWTVLFVALNSPHAHGQNILTEPKITIDLNNGELADLVILLSSESYAHTKNLFPKQVYRFGKHESLVVSRITLHVNDTPLPDVVRMLRAEYNLCAWRHEWRIRSQPVVDINFGYCDREPPLPDNMKDRFQAYP